jgi:hypothetical protein
MKSAPGWAPIFLALSVWSLCAQDQEVIRSHPCRTADFIFSQVDWSPLP